jgi:hypothetical protein
MSDIEPQTPAPVTDETKPIEEKKFPEPQVSEKFRAAAQREKQANQRMREAKALQAQVLAQQQKVQEFEQYKAQARQNPLKALESLGLTYEDLAQYMVNGGKPSIDSEIKSVREEFEQWKKQFEEKELSQKQEQEKLKQLQEQKALEDFTKSIESFVEQNKDTYKFVNAYSGSQIILNHCIEHAKRTGDVLDMKEAAQAAEDYLREEWKKGQALMQPVAEQPGEPRKTLNNSMSQTLSSAPSMLPAKNENERLKRALAALGG